MTKFNDITGDSIASRASTQRYRDNYDRIFGNKKINNSGVSGVFVSVVDIPSPTPEVIKIIKETEIVSDFSQCENIAGEDAEAFCQELVKLPDFKAMLREWADKDTIIPEIDSLANTSPEQIISDTATRYRKMMTLEEVLSTPAPKFVRPDGSLSNHESPSDEIPFLQQSGPTPNADDWFKKILTENTPPPFIPPSYNPISVPNINTAEEYEKAVYYGILVPDQQGNNINVNNDTNIVQTSSNKSSIDSRSELPYSPYVSDRNVPLVYVGPILDAPVITVENCYKWYSLFALMPDGKVRKITSDEIYQADNLSEAWHIDHNFHPRLLSKLAEMLKGEVCAQSLEMVAGRWVMEQMGDPFKFIDPAKYEL